MDTEQQWAAALGQSKRKRVMQDTLPFGLQKKQNQNRIAIAKSALQAAVRANDAAAIRQLWEQLVELRSDQMRLTLAELRERFGTVEDPIIEREMKSYLQDCYRLALLLR